MAITRRAMAVAAAGALVPGGSPPRAQARWLGACPWAGQNPLARNLQRFLDDVQRATGGALQIRLSTGGSLLTAAQIRPGLRRGQVQLGTFPLAIEADEPMLEVDAVPMLVQSLRSARQLTALSEPFIEQRLQLDGLTLLYLAPWPPPGLFSSFAISSVSDLRGTRMRSMTHMGARMANLAGATAARVEPEELAQAFATRIANTMMASAAIGVDVEAWRFARFFTPLDIVFPKDAVCVQTRAFEALPASQRKVLREAAAAAADRAWAMAVSEQPVLQEVLSDHGITVRPPSAQLLAGLGQVGATMLDEWRARAGEPGARLLEALGAG
jgi:TRAP-type C4-dicarboxylate transport system substrate-binding protein